MPSGAEAARALFRHSFGRHPHAIASAPGRVNLIGEHTDYNGGEVLPIAIERRTWVAAAPASGSLCRCVSATRFPPGQFDVRDARAGAAWWDYIAGVARELTDDWQAPSAFDLAVAGDVPAGAGLGSSAALAVAAGAALLAMRGVDPDRRRVALAAHRAETRYVGVACGIMDQFASALSRRAHALHIRCDTGATDDVPFDDAVLIFDTGVRRALRDAAFNARRAECERAFALLRRVRPQLSRLAAADAELIHEAALPEPLTSRALHVVLENKRVAGAVAALRDSGSLPGALLVESHASLRTLYDCSAPELDWFVSWMLQREGVTGARLTGAGWGGCAIATGAPSALEAAMEPLLRTYIEAFGRAGAVSLTTADDAVRIEDGL